MSNDILKMKEWIDNADAIMIGAGAGLSDASGIHYSGEKFKKDFHDFIEKYGFQDLYTSSFYPFPCSEEKWAYWAKHIYFSYYENQDNELYHMLYQLVQQKDYFVITTNVDGKFIQNGFSTDKVFEVQGSYSKFQCSVPCHNQLYDNKKIVFDMLDAIDKDLKIPSRMIPKCPVCGEEMEVNLRSDDTFVEDDHWKLMNDRYSDFLKKYDGKKLLLLEFGVGFNTPSIIRYPFEEITYRNSKVRLIRFNQKYFDVPSNIQKKSISVSNDISIIIHQLLEGESV